MAPQQSALMRFLFEARVPAGDIVGEPIPIDVHGNSSNIVAELQPTPKTDDIADFVGNNVLKPAEPAMSSLSDCIVLNAISTSIAVVD
jgi:hypothetical protein